MFVGNSRAKTTVGAPTAWLERCGAMVNQKLKAKVTSPKKEQGLLIKKLIEEICQGSIMTFLPHPLLSIFIISFKNFASCGKYWQFKILDLQQWAYHWSWMSVISIDYVMISVGTKIGSKLIWSCLSPTLIGQFKRLFMCII